MASIRIGTIFTGKVDAINQESIQTKFFVLGLPLFPLKSYYCLGTTHQGVQGFPIKLNLKSIIMAYLRWWFGIASVVGIILAFAANEYYLLLPSFVGAAIAISTIWIGHLSKKEKSRRQVLVNVVGMGTPPSLLPQNTVIEVSAKLENAWKKSAYGSYQENWRSVSSVSSVPSQALPLLYCLALYNKNEQLAEKVWLALESSIQAQINRKP